MPVTLKSMFHHSLMSSEPNCSTKGQLGTTSALFSHHSGELLKHLQAVEVVVHRQTHCNSRVNQ